jgi:hypothetical protein
MFVNQMNLLPLLAILGLSVSCGQARKILPEGDDGAVVFNVEGIEKLDAGKQQFHVEIVKLDTLDSLAGTVERKVDFEIQSEITMTEIDLGPKEFQLSVIAKDGSGTVFYYGTGKHLVRPGTQKIDQPIALKKKEFGGQLVSVNGRIQLSLGTGAAAGSGDIVLPDNVKAVLAKGNCAGCHNPTNKNNEEIYLDKFPFTSDRSKLDSLEKIIEIMAQAIDPALDPDDDIDDMPEGTSLDAADIAIFTAWYKSLSAPAAPNPTTGDISTLPIDLVEITWKAEKYEFISGKTTLSKVATGLYEGQFANVPVGENLVATLTVGNAGQTYVKDAVLTVIKVEGGKALEYQAQIPKPGTSVSVDVVIQ